jgi:hypothetical protein
VYGSALGAGDDSWKGSAARADPNGDGVRVNAVVRADAIVHIGRPEGYIQVYLNIFCWSDADIFDEEAPMVGICWSISVTATFLNVGKLIVV